MVLIRRSDVPIYLQSTAFYNLLDPDDNEEFDVPPECWKQDLSINCHADLCHYVRSIQYWGAEDISETAYTYMLRNCSADYLESFGKQYFHFHEIFTLIQRLQAIYPESLISKALEFKASVDCIRWIHEHVYWRLSTADCTAAAKSNNLPTLTYLHEQSCPWDEQTVLAAITSGHLDCLKYALSEDCPKPGNDDCLREAAHHGQVEVLKYLLSIGLELNEDILMHAVSPVGSLTCVKYLLQAGCDRNVGPLIEAVRLGKLDCLQYLHEQGFELKCNYITYFAASCGQLACLIYARRHGCPWHPETTAIAAANNQLACLQYAHSDGCPWDPSTVRLARFSHSWKCLYFAVWHSAVSDMQYIIVDLLFAGLILCFLLRRLILCAIG